MSMLHTPLRIRPLVGLFLAVVFLTATAGVFYTDKEIGAFWKKKEKEEGRARIDIPPTVVEKTEEEDKAKKILIESGDVYGDVMDRAGIEESEATAIYKEAESEYDLSRIKEGEYMFFTYTPEEELKRVLYNIDGKERLIVERRQQSRKRAEENASSTSAEVEAAGEWRARVESIPYKVKTVTAEGEVDTSLYKAALEEGLEAKTIVEFAEAFQWMVDFAMEVRKGDTFKLVYEKKYLDGEYIRPGRIWAARYVNDGEEHEVFYYGSEEHEGYFTYEGESAQRMFLKAPVAYKYISSGYTRGARYLAKFEMYTSSHKAVDYAAESGTPIRSVGDGVVTTAGWSNAGYGYLTAVRHNSTYTTRYAHQSRLAVKPGERVKQGDVIGYVGSTGLSTGPHLHYEMLKNGVKIDPLSIDLPSNDSLPDSELRDFHNFVDSYKKMLEEES